MSQRFGWGHININVGDLDASIAFYQKLGFEVFIPGIPYLDLNHSHQNRVSAASGEALGLPEGVQGRACIMQLDGGFPKLDLTELNTAEPRVPLRNADRGLVRICLVSQDLAADYAYLTSEGVEFVSSPRDCHERLAKVATCSDPDGTLIELLQVYLDRWPPIPGVNS
jgi:catechol 2,3-dioxygenase-like lactoylglutathione lyase family enzyme